MLKILKAAEVSAQTLFERRFDEQDVSRTVSEIIQNVVQNGDKALFEYCERFDGAKLSALEVSREEIEQAYAAADPELIRILQRAAGNICAFHEKQLQTGYMISDQPGVMLGVRVLPLARVGLYVPGGTAAYPSTVLMNAIPAKIAGVGEIVMVTPPSGGDVNPSILAAAKVAGVDRVFKLGGAQAVAALAYGTQSVPRVDKITGPGNVYVAEAKRQVYGRVAIDMIAGPSEILVIADETANPAFVAADLLSQAEHDPNAVAVLLTTSAALANAVNAELQTQLARLSRQEIARASLKISGRIILVEDIASALALSNEIAPEHLELCVHNPFDYLSLVKNAGSVFLGKYAPEALGDYFAGPNHTLPTSGTARFSSPVSVDDFVKKMQYTYYTKAAIAGVAGDIARFANEEGLGAHANSVTIRMQAEEGDETL